jgi:hypothetical protein
LSSATKVTPEMVEDVVGQLNTDLSAEAGSTPALPIDWPTWAASFQRHLAADVVAAVQLESERYGRKDVAREVATKQERMLGHLPLFPFAKLKYALDDVQRAEAMKDVVGLMLRHPETITAENWRAGVELHSGRVASGVTPQSVWFRTLVPAGTAYDAAHRVSLYKLTNHLSADSLHDVRVLAPYTRYLLEEEMRWRYTDSAIPPLAEYRREAGPLADYDVHAMDDVLTSAKENASEYVPLAQRLCHLQAEKCSSLGAYLSDHDRDDEAAQVYQYFVDHVRDQVAMSNSAEWLVTYYYTHDQRTKARELADKAGAVFSYRGLRTKARLLEREGNYQDAEATLKRAIERYGAGTRDTMDLAAFYVRWNKAFGDAGVNSVADALVAKYFPHGLERVDVAKIAAPPKDGGRLTAIGERGAHAGFVVDDVVVAIDGIRVHNYDQLYLVWYMDAAPEITFTVWRNGKFVTIHGPFRESWRNWYAKTYRAATN